MTNRDDIERWLRQKRYRVIHTDDPARRIVERLVLEGRAEWNESKTRARASKRLK